MENKNRRTSLIGALSLCLLLATAGSVEAGAFTDQFRLQDCRWRVTGGNAFFSLQAGRQTVLEGDDDGEQIRQIITNLREYERITFEYNGQTMSVRTRVVEEREFEDDEVVEVSRNFFARCHGTNDIFYFGEDVIDYEDGEPVGMEGAWRAGEEGAVPGLIMPGSFLKGARYFQEIAPENDALDRGQNVGMGLQVETPIGTFEGCVSVRETTQLDPGEEGTKVYCPDVGIVLDEDLIITSFGRVP